MLAANLITDLLAGRHRAKNAIFVADLMLASITLYITFSGDALGVYV